MSRCAGAQRSGALETSLACLEGKGCGPGMMGRIAYPRARMRAWEKETGFEWMKRFDRGEVDDSTGGETVVAAGADTGAAVSAEEEGFSSWPKESCS